MQWLAIHQPEIRLLVGIAFPSCQGVVYGSKDLAEGDVVQGEGEYVMVKSLVMQEVHGIVHGGGNVESGRNNVVSMRFEGI